MAHALSPVIVCKMGRTRPAHRVGAGFNPPGEPRTTSGPPGASASAGPGFRGGSEQAVRLSRRRQRGAALLAWPGRAEVSEGGRVAGARPYHAGGDAAGAGADHHVADLAAPEPLAFGVGHEGQGRLLQLVGGLVGWSDRGRGVRAPHAPAYPAWETPGACQRPCPGPAWSSSFALTTGAVWVLPATLWWAEGPCPHSREGGDALLTGDTGGGPPLLAAVREQPPPAALSWQLLSC